MGFLSFDQNSPVSIRLTPWASESSDLGRGTGSGRFRRGRFHQGNHRGSRWGPGSCGLRGLQVCPGGEGRAPCLQSRLHTRLWETPLAAARRPVGQRRWLLAHPGGSRPQGHGTPAPPVPLSPHARAHRPRGAGPIPRLSAVQSEKGFGPGDLSPNLGSHLATRPP